MTTMANEMLPVPERLTDKLAGLLTQLIETGELEPDERLPTEQRLSKQYGVSRTVVREAVSRLKSIGLLVSRQGAGVFVAPRDQARPLTFDRSVLSSLDGVLQVVEVRRGLDADVAALAAQRMTSAKARKIGAALAALEACPPFGAEGVAVDLEFHRSIARASDNPHYERLLGFLEQYQRDAMMVNRTVEARDSEYMFQVRDEHRAIAAAVMGGDQQAAREAASRHMVNAAGRIKSSVPIINGTFSATERADTSTRGS